MVRVTMLSLRKATHYLNTQAERQHVSCSYFSRVHGSMKCFVARAEAHLSFGTTLVEVGK